MIWVVILIVMLLIGGYGAYRFSGEGYSAGRGMFKNSDDCMNEHKDDFSDYDPYEFKNMRK